MPLSPPTPSAHRATSLRFGSGMRGTSARTSGCVRAPSSCRSARRAKTKLESILNRPEVCEQPRTRAPIVLYVVCLVCFLRAVLVARCLLYVTRCILRVECACCTACLAAQDGTGHGHAAQTQHYRTGTPAVRYGHSTPQCSQCDVAAVRTRHPVAVPCSGSREAFVRGTWWRRCCAWRSSRVRFPETNRVYDSINRTARVLISTLPRCPFAFPVAAPSLSVPLALVAVAPRTYNIGMFLHHKIDRACCSHS